ncbi:uncharacterized protein [Atheta coriaria]|uniref:uncharacterized protein n=1 Tax=Dalotia coriaria TaxID=877792 RepID=UPI0031F46AA5
MERALGIENQLANGSPQWIDESMDSPLTSTMPNDKYLEDDGTVWGLVMIVFGALAIIIIMFLIALFIDCRQQKLAELQQAKHAHHVQRRKKMRFKGPTLAKTIEEDTESFAYKMQTPMSEPPV